VLLSATHPNKKGTQKPKPHSREDDEQVSDRQDTARETAFESYSFSNSKENQTITQTQEPVAAAA